MDERSSIRVRDLVRPPAGELATGLQTSSDADRSRADAEYCSGKIKHVLRQLGLTLTDVSVFTGERYGKRSPYFIPITFCYRLKQGITPRLCQLVALSQITGYRFSDWMRICGFDPRLVLGLQLQLDNERTTIINPTYVSRTRDGTPAWFDGVGRPCPRYVFAKIGARDAVLYPRLVPGTVIRADSTYWLQLCGSQSIENRIWLVEHAGGITCCYIKRIDDDHIVLLPNLPPLTAWPLQLWREVRILGLVDLEWRPGVPVSFRPMSSCRIHDSPRSGLWSDTSELSLSRLLRLSRSRAGLTLRAAHEMTTRIAKFLGRREYAIALGLLSDYEAMNRVPRHVAKIVSLCVIYGIDLFQLLESAGICIDDSGHPIVDVHPTPHKRHDEFALRTTGTFGSVA